MGDFTLNVNEETEKLIKTQAIATFNHLYKGEEEALTVLTKERQELVKKIERLEERFINEDIAADLYNKFCAKFSAEKDDLDRRIQKASQKSSNLENCIELALKIASKMAYTWSGSDYSTKRQIQSLVFPEGITYNKKKEEVRTSRINLAFSYLTLLQQK